jgi:hypothetical protein
MSAAVPFPLLNEYRRFTLRGDAPAPAATAAPAASR